MQDFQSQQQSISIREAQVALRTLLGDDPLYSEKPREYLSYPAAGC